MMDVQLPEFFTTFLDASLERIYALEPVFEPTVVLGMSCVSSSGLSLAVAITLASLGQRYKYFIVLHVILSLHAF